MTADYLFEQSLARACAQAGLVTSAGKPTITAHQFLHTVGTELAEGGARLHTIMKMLGHTRALPHSRCSRAANQHSGPRFPEILGRAGPENGCLHRECGRAATWHLSSELFGALHALAETADRVDSRDSNRVGRPG